MPRCLLRAIPLGVACLVLLPSARASAPPTPGPQVRAHVTGGGDLQIQGDDGDNVLTVGQPVGGGDRLTISVPLGQSLNDTPGPASMMFEGVTRGIHAKLGRGDDRIEIIRIELAGDAKIDLGDGSDFINLFDSTIHGDFEVKGGQGDDTLRNTAGRVGGDCRVDFGDGDNAIYLDLFAQGDMKLKTKDGRDVIALSDYSGAAGKLKIETGGGNDLIGMYSGTEAGDDLHVDTGDGDDIVTLVDCATVGGDAHIDLGKGDDDLQMRGLVVGGDLRVDAGPGADQVYIEPSTRASCPRSVLQGDVRVRLGDGDDTLEMAGTDVDGTLDADGGKDDDSFVDLGGNVFGSPPKIDHFEVLVP